MLNFNLNIVNINTSKRNRLSLVAMCCSVLFLIFFGFGNIVMAQDTESKDVISIITIYVKMKTVGVNSLYTYRADSLKRTLEAIEGVKNVKIQLTKQLVSFEIPSNKVMSEQSLRKIVSKVGFSPMTIQFLKEKEDDVEDVPPVL